jgi:hypothetical protein
MMMRTGFQQTATSARVYPNRCIGYVLSDVEQLVIYNAANASDTETDDTDSIADTDDGKDEEVTPADTA